MARQFELRRIVLAGIAVLFVGQIAVAPVAAQDANALVTKAMTSALLAPALSASETLATGSIEAAGAEAVAAVAAPIRPSTATIVSPRSSEAVMIPLYAATAALQMLDAHSTLTALSNGAREANPFMTGFASNKYALIGVKAAVTASMIYSIHKMARHNRVGAVIMAVAVNSVYAAVVAHNYKIARRTY